MLSADFWLGFLQIVQLEQIRTVMHFFTNREAARSWVTWISSSCSWDVWLRIDFCFYS